MIDGQVCGKIGWARSRWALELTNSGIWESNQADLGTGGTASPSLRHIGLGLETTVETWKKSYWFQNVKRKLQNGNL